MMRPLRPYSAYKDSGVEWLGKVPAHWDVRRVRTIASVVNGATPSSNVSSYWGGDIVWVTPQDLGALASRYVKTSARTITRDGYESCSATIVPAGSVAISTRAPIGHTAIFTAEACTNQGCRVLVPNDLIQADHLFYSLKVARPELESLGQGTTFSELSRDQLCGFPLSLPPLPEQAAIVRFLGHAARRIRRYIRAKQKLITLLEEQKQAIIHRAVTGRIDVRTGKPYPAYKDSRVEWLGRIPQRWRAVSLGRLTLDRCDGPFGSGLKSSHYTDEGIRVVRLQNIGHGTFNDEDAVYIAPEHYATLGDHSVQPGDLLIAGLGDPHHPAGRACVAPTNIRPAMVKADCFRFRVDHEAFLSEFAALHLTATASAASAVLSTGATRQRTNLQSTTGRHVVVPSKSEQAQVVEYCSAEKARLDAVEQAAGSEILLLREYRTRLIADVVTGKLDVREAAAGLPEGDPLADEFNALTTQATETGVMELEDANESPAELTMDNEVII